MYTSIKFKWVGYRKDSGRGSLCGWFVYDKNLKEDTDPFTLTYFNYPDLNKKEYYGHMFWGSIGKKLQFEKIAYTPEFLSMINSKKKNFKTIEADKMINRWGKEFDNEFEMYLMLLKLQG